jgi:hypothetical protein
MGGPEPLRAWTGPRHIDRPNALVQSTVQAEPEIIRVAFMGRTSTKDQQDSTLSIPRQFNNCTKALPENAMIVVSFYDRRAAALDLRYRSPGQAHRAQP